MPNLVVNTEYDSMAIGKARADRCPLESGNTYGVGTDRISRLVFRSVFHPTPIRRDAITSHRKQSYISRVVVLCPY